MTERTLDELLYHMPTVQRHASNEWVRGFAASIVRQSRRRNWNPSDKQMGTMRRLVAELFTADKEEDEIILVE
ncbi:hypothetical protein [Palleronia sp. LCG004]|uniref:hypothetical protein n=1 Tax=Palleronia sp. LCG004 TaxID=3079304 RepID=UPI0029439C2E|nr:hypothetical protein [Palleronia sp. LCG004]WOI55140.1 hypothetical protein RVY76_08705 [Palleronia sp. LCG004]